ncbi:hypothetical protein DYI37_03415 [Fulvimarina endophytica]|uniref:Endonuclease/exonuclease/phosphatase domain-containing protein n=1 Tax=Fulvimarina endophytica TaxID=2293836 RepID=A0A371XBA7_9HYPH|nr:endonuclease/exonuclease/phosphatase family protein [Fulvimarina endophytica]RFC66499.1 hypothetical protein DYI37_03415 [Fulvimarina endophytica]
MARPDEDGAPIRIVSWNIHGTMGRGGKADRERTLSEIVRFDPDILILQEVDERTGFGRPADAFDFLRDGLTLKLVGPDARPADHCRDVKTGSQGGCVCGNLFFTRLPILKSDVIDLPGPDIEARKAIDVTLAAGSAVLRVIGTHFGLLPTTRRRQAGAIAKRLGEGPSAAKFIDEPTIVLGDLNEWSRHGWVDRALSPVLPTVYAPKSWPERFPIVSLDRIYASDRVEIVSARTDGEAGKASDHLPLIADIRIVR